MGEKDKLRVTIESVEEDKGKYREGSGKYSYILTVKVEGQNKREQYRIEAQSSDGEGRSNLRRGDNITSIAPWSETSKDGPKIPLKPPIFVEHKGTRELGFGVRGPTDFIKECKENNELLRKIQQISKGATRLAGKPAATQPPATIPTAKPSMKEKPAPEKKDEVQVIRIERMKDEQGRQIYVGNTRLFTVSINGEERKFEITRELMPNKDTIEKRDGEEITVTAGREGANITKIVDVTDPANPKTKSFEKPIEIRGDVARTGFNLVPYNGTPGFLKELGTVSKQEPDKKPEPAKEEAQLNRPPNTVMLADLGEFSPPDFKVPLPFRSNKTEIG